MKYLILLALFLPACSHIPQTCDMYCISHGGSCDRVEAGYEVYNTTTGNSDRTPTRFVCKYNF